MALPFFMPERFAPGPPWLVPAVEGCFLVAMAITDPGRINRRSVVAHRVRLALVVLLVSGSAWATMSLSRVLVQGDTSITGNASSLLTAGALVWIALTISFTFLYWELDIGGPGERGQKIREHPDLAFPQDTINEISAPDWRPVFVDYLYLGITNGIAFSPTDTMPLAHWAKLAMALQSVTSLMIIGLVIARAVNILQ